MFVDLLGKKDVELFQTFFERISCNSVQCGLNWRNLIRDMNVDEPYFIITKSNHEITGVLPLYLFKGKFGNILTSNAWNTISGIVSSGSGKEKKIHQTLLDYAISLAHELDCATLTVGTNPFMDHHCLHSRLNPDYTLENFIQFIQVRDIFDNQGNFCHTNYTKRTNLSRSLSKLLDNELVLCDEQKSEYLLEAYRLQVKRMKELGSTPFPIEFFFSAYNNIVKKNQGKFVFVFYGKQMIATCLFLYSHNMIDVYLLCMDTDFKQLRANFAITNYLLTWAYKNNIEIFNWMSSPRRGDGVYKWKEQWGSQERIFRYYTKVTGDISSWKKLSIAELISAYKFHYLLPFNLLNAPGTPIFTTKDEVASFVYGPVRQAKVTA